MTRVAILVDIHKFRRSLDTSSLLLGNFLRDTSAPLKAKDGKDNNWN
jgi:hypothetical protein